jgi:MtfA peptidase
MSGQSTAKSHLQRHKSQRFRGERRSTIGDSAKRRTWNQVIDQELARLQMEASQGQPTFLDPYGTKNRAEFLAVATESFLERPHAMRTRHLDLYQLLADFYCHDVAAWLPDAHDAT